MSLTESDINRVIGSTLYGAGGEKIGNVGQVFFDDFTGRPEWVTVQTGFFGTKESFVPVAEAQVDPSAVPTPGQQQQQQAQQTAEQARQAAQQAADSTRRGATWGFFGLLLGAVAASIGGLLGSRSVANRKTAPDSPATGTS